MSQRIERAVLGIDLGTQSTKAAVVTVNGRQLAQASVPVSARRPSPGWMEHDAALLEQTALAAGAQAVSNLTSPAEVAAIGVAGQMGGAIGVDEHLRPVTPYESWMDTRADQVRGEVLAAAGKAIVNAGGIVPLAGARVRRWIAEQPALLDVMRAVLAPTGYLVGRLTGATGADASCDRTQANVFGCYRAADRSWDPSLAAAVGIPAALLPRLVDPAEVVGGLTPQAANALGLPVGLPVVGGLGDGTAGWLAGGGVAPGRCVETGGTSANLAITVDAFTPDPARVLTCMPAADPRLWYLLGFTTGTGLTHRWVTEVLADGDYATLERAAAAEPPGARGVRCVPHIHGRVTPVQPQVRGAFLGFDEQTTRAQLYRAVIESLTYELAGWLTHARRLSPESALTTLASIGGGANSRLWAQIKADVTGAPVLRMKPVVNAARGAALVAAAGLRHTTLDAAEWHTDQVIAQTHEPDPEAHHRYAPLAAAYPRLVEALAPAYAELASADDTNLGNTRDPAQLPEAPHDA